MKTVVLILEWILFIYLAVQVVYLFFFSVAGKLSKTKIIKTAGHLRLIRILIPAYKEDAVIIETVRFAVAHDYPKSRFEVVVIADSLTDSTLKELKKTNAKIIEVNFEKSTKGKALQHALNETKNKPADIILILDADNHMASGFLHKMNNAFDAGFEIVQGHRTAKYLQTSFARLDACTEEINNHIFRRGHNAVGLPAALIGSGMAFDNCLFTTLLNDIGDTAGEDKEIEFRAVRLRKKILFLDNALVYDEKVAREEIFSKQRSRWLATQVEFFNKYFIEGWAQLFNGNVPFFNKVFQTYLLPRIMLIGIVGLFWVLSLLFANQWFAATTILLSLLTTSLLIAIPARWYNRHLLGAFIQIPTAFISMLSAYKQISKAKREFIHTPHGETL